MASINTVTEGLYMLRELIPNWDISQQTIKVWVLALKDLTDAQVIFAFEKYITHSTSDFNKIPRPGDLRKIIETAESTTWDQAFREIQSKAHYCLYPVFSAGKVHEVEWSSPEVREAMYRMGGPESFVKLEEDNLGTARAQFRQIWQNMEHKARIGNLPALAAADNHLIAEHVSNLAKKMGFNS